MKKIEIDFLNSLISTITIDYLPQRIEWICAYNSIATIVVVR